MHTRAIRRLAVMMAFLAAPSALQAQRSWQPEVGLRAGFVHMSPSGGTDLSFWDLPGGGFLGLTAPAPASLFGVVPMHGPWAIEIGLGVDQLASGLGDITTFVLAPRLDYALTSHAYVAAGPTMSTLRLSSQGFTAWGAAGAIGYRIALSPRLTGRIEGFYEHRFEVGSTSFPATEIYGVTIGAAAALGPSAAGATRGAREHRPAPGSAPWVPSLVLSGGFTNVFAPEGGNVSFFTLPGLGVSASNALSTLVVTPPALTAIIPIGGRFAIEPGVDVHSFTPSGGSASTLYQVTARANYAIDRHLYAAIGGAYGAASGGGISYNEFAVTAAAGIRFPIAGGIGGRLEYNYATWNGDGSNAPALQTNSLLFGMVAPLR
ncbi:MAG: hypothetical protein ACREL4_04035 [Gemmatimonadales bacterium]